MTKGENVSQVTDKVIESVQNGVHLYRIRDALSRGHAAVMIGAGYSRNASGGRRLPGWRALVDGLLEDLYPSEEVRTREAHRFGGTSGSLRLAQEYAAVLGRAQLDARLHDLLPDEGCTEPGYLHTRLLSLPWADVFTTNYDTLLERTLEVDRRQLTPSIQRRYQIVKASTDLPFSRSNGAPRIVKLHGTLRASAPLIITEEDYRCYPREHAPFVNMVQQSMLENVFCLLGFSGDDPNFIEWSGWTRDRLGPQAPPIYLITLEPVTEGQRLILEERKIFPIPIGTLAGADADDWIQDAFSALLDFWHGQPPPRPAAWGDGYRTPNTLDANPVGQLIKWTRSARDVRVEYPGWLVAPERNRERVASRCGAVFSRLIYQKLCSSMSPELRLAYLFEVNWILETTLTPLTKAHANDYEAALTELYRGESAQLAPHDFTEELWYGAVDTRQHWESLAVALIRYFRETRDAANFEFWKQEFLSRVSGGRDSETLRWMRYEETLFQLENFQHDEARETLENWYVYADTADPYWLVRAGALFGELGDPEQGRHLAQAGLHKIRAAIQTDGETTYLVSREHWAELILRVASTASEYSESKWKSRQRARSPELPRNGAIEDGVSSSVSVQRNTSIPPKAIPRKAHARESADHPEHQIELIEREFGRFAKILTETTFDFDEPEVASRYHRLSISKDALAAAVSYVKMVEMSGYVPRFGELALSAGAMIEAFTVLSTANPVESTIRVLLRANANDRFATLDALTRENVARLSLHAAEIIVGRAFELADAHLGEGRDSLPAPKAHKVIFALELVSRLLCRLDQAAALDALHKFLYWHDLPSVQQEDGLHEHFKDYFHRVLCVLRPEVVTPFLPALIGLKPEPRTLSRMSRWPRVVQELMDRIPVDVTQKEWLSVANGALDDARLARDDETMMAFHLGRLDWLFTHQLLSVSQSRALAALVWDGVPTGTLPTNVPGFYHGALLTWPAPQRINKQSIFKSWVLAQPLADIVERFEEDGIQKRSITPGQETLLTNILLTRNVRDMFAWTSNELLTISDNLRAWWIREGRRLVGEAAADDENGFSRPLLIRRMRLLGHVLQRVVAPDMSRDAALAASIPEWLSEMWEASRQLGAPMPQFLFAALHWWPDRTSIVLRIATESIASATEENFTTAMHAAGHWLIRNTQPSVASRQYLSLLVNAITLRLDGRLDAVLTSICELLTLGAVAHFRSCVDTLFPTLRGLLEELQGHEYDTGFVDVESRAQLRQRTVKAMTLLVGAFPTLRGDDWQRCQELAATDPLVDVRNLVPLH